MAAQTGESTPGSLGSAAAIGAIAGVSLTSRWGVAVMATAGVAGGLVVAVTDVVARARRRPGEIPVAERVNAEDLPFVVPLEARTGTWAPDTCATWPAHSAEGATRTWPTSASWPRSTSCLVPSSIRPLWTIRCGERLYRSHRGSDELDFANTAEGHRQRLAA